MTRQELDARAGQLRKRQNRRVMITLGTFMLVFFGSAWLLDAYDLRDSVGLWFVWPSVIILGVGHWRTFTQPSIDCRELGLICPACRNPLVSRGRMLVGGNIIENKGHCWHCGSELIDGVPQPEVALVRKEPLTTMKVVKIALIQIVTLLLFYFLLWKLGLYPLTPDKH